MGPKLEFEHKFDYNPVSWKSPSFGYKVAYKNIKLQEFQDCIAKEACYLWEKEPIDKPVILYIKFVIQIKDKSKWGKYCPKRPDIDNLHKSLVDAIKPGKKFSGIIKDDSLVVETHVEKRYGEKGSSAIKVYTTEW